MPRSFHIPRRFHPGHSLLGCGLRRLTGDVRRAEALLVVALVGGLLVLVGSQALAWTLLQAPLTQDPRGPVAIAFWGGQAAALAVYVLVGWIGFQPAITVRCMANGLILRQGRRALEIPYQAIDAAETVDALAFHRHWSRYAATHVFANRLPDRLLLLRTTSGPVVLGFSPSDQQALVAHLERQAEAVAR